MIEGGQQAVGIGGCKNEITLFSLRLYLPAWLPIVPDFCPPLRPISPPHRFTLSVYDEIAVVSGTLLLTLLPYGIINDVFVLCQASPQRN